MVLVDTSVWIRFVANTPPYASQLDALLAREAVIGHELVFGELLIGDRGGRGKLLAAYQQMLQATMIPHAEVVAFVRARTLHGLGLGWVDIHLLASALAGRFLVWTADARFAALVEKLGLAYSAGRSKPTK